MKKTAGERISIFFSGDEPDDRKFAEDIASESSAWGTSVLIDVDELRRIDVSYGPGKRPQFFGGAGVYIISREMLQKDHHRRNLNLAPVNVAKRGRRYFFICRNISLEEVRRDFPDMERLCDDLMIGEKEDLPFLLEDLKIYLLHAKQLRSRPFSDAVELIGSQLMIWGYLLLHYSYHTGYLAPLALGYVLVKGIENGAYGLLAVLSFFTFGGLLSRQSPLDLWPWFGRLWIAPLPEEGMGSPLQPYPMDAAQKMLKMITTLAFFSDGKPDLSPQCLGSHFRMALQTWLGLVSRARKFIFYSAFYFLLPSVLWLYLHMKDFPGLIPVAVLGFLAGALYPSMYDKAASLRARRLARRYAVSNDPEDARKLDQIIMPDNFGTSTFAITDKSSGDILMFNQTLDASCRRALLAKPDLVFISYARKEDEFSPVVAEIARGLESSGIRYWYDREVNTSRFSSWRAEVGEGLIQATHLIVVIGPKTTQGNVISREWDISFRRWNNELYPSIICVCDDAVAEGLLSNPETPPSFHFILSACPRLNPNQAKDPFVLSCIISQRRRQGTLRDVMDLLFPQQALARHLKDAGGLADPEALLKRKLI